MKKITIVTLLSMLLINSAWAVDFSELKFKRQHRERIAFLKKDNQPYTGIATSFFDNGQKKYEAYYWNGKKHGPDYTWAKTGELKEETHWLNNQKQGNDITWKRERNKDGKTYSFNKSKQQSYVNDEQTGLEIRWYKGNKTGSIEYVNDEKNGLETDWNNGQLESQFHYIDGDRYGLARTFYKDGSLKVEYTKNSHGYDGRHMSWAENGTMTHSNFYTDGKYHGISNDYYDTGILRTEISYRNGKKTGNQIDNYASGTPYLLWATQAGKRIKYYKNTNQRIYEYYSLGDYRHKNQYEWYQNGQAESISAYDMDRMKGLRTTWHPNGYKKSEAIQDGYDVNGSEKEWYNNGQLKSLRHLIQGEEDGISRIWYRNGQLKSETNYSRIKNGRRASSRKHGDSLEWYADGKKKVEEHYINDDLTGIRRTWLDDGTLYSERDMSATEQ